MTSRLSLRVRVALAFTIATALALAVLGAFVHLRVERSLEESLRDTVNSELEYLLALPPADRAEAATRTTGEVVVEVLTDRSGGASPRLRSTMATARSPAGWSDRRLDLTDDEGLESELCLIRVRRVDGQVLAAGTSRTDADAALAAVRRQLFLGGPVALLVASLLGYAVASAGLRPVERMRRQAATISSRSSSERLPLPMARDELHRLGVTLNAMLDRLDEGLQRERRFVAEASHELRTPLALLRTELDLALSRRRTAAELEAALRSASDETEALIALARDLLTLASMDEPGVPLDVMPIDLTALAATVAGRFAPAADHAGRSIAVVHATAPVRVEGDRLRLEQVVSNLVHNALVHGAGAVTVTVDDGPDSHATVVVADAGAGFPSDLLATAAEPFARGASAHRLAGAGLGLAISRAILEAHGGSLTVENGAGGGARVTARVPHAQPS